jgi:hypothetical protein
VFTWEIKALAQKYYFLKYKNISFHNVNNIWRQSSPWTDVRILKLFSPKKWRKN